MAAEMAGQPCQVLLWWLDGHASCDSMSGVMAG